MTSHQPSDLLNFDPAAPSSGLASTGSEGWRSLRVLNNLLSTPCVVFSSNDKFAKYISKRSLSSSASKLLVPEETQTQKTSSDWEGKRCVYHLECISFWALNLSILVDRVTDYLAKKWSFIKLGNDTGLNDVIQTLITRGRACLIRFQTTSSSPVWVENRLH